MAESKPNVLLIMSDQHHPYISGYAGDARADTPHIDRLAAEGVNFANTHCSFPLCGPSRMSFMTGRHPYEIECLTNLCQLRSDLATFAHGFTAAGYETVLSGRMHFSGIDQRHGFQKRIVSDVGGSAYLTRKDLWKLDVVLGDLIDTPGLSYKGVVKSGPGTTGYHAYDEAVTRHTVDWLDARGRDGGTQPFMLTVGYAAPHCPFVAPRADFERYYKDMDVPSFDYEALHPAIQRFYRQAGFIDHPVSDDDIRRARAAYYGLCTFLDRQVGAVLDALDHAGLADDTIVIYTSDHGEQIGEHGQWWKCTFYQSSVGVPMIVRMPDRRRAGSTVKQNVSLMDIGPTLLDLVGARPLPAATGRSFAKLIDGDASDWPDEVFAENIGPANESGGGAWQRMVRRGPWKYCYYHDEPAQIINLDTDPHENHDRIDEPQCADIAAQLRQRVLTGWSPRHIDTVMRTRHAELKLFDTWASSFEPYEPDPRWFDTPPVNRLETP